MLQKDQLNSCKHRSTLHCLQKGCCSSRVMRQTLCNLPPCALTLSIWSSPVQQILSCDGPLPAARRALQPGLGELLLKSGHPCLICLATIVNLWVQARQEGKHPQSYAISCIVSLPALRLSDVFTYMESRIHHKHRAHRDSHRAHRASHPAPRSHS